MFTRQVDGWLAPLSAPAGVARSGETGDFSAEGARIRAETIDFIERGSVAQPIAARVPAAAGLSAEGAWLRSRALAGQAGVAAEGPQPDAALGASAESFVDGLLPHAQKAARALGVSPGLVIAHAALETGWGRSPLPGADGQPGFNLFGIKAGGRWQGSAADAVTTEHENGRDVKRVEQFRSYGSLADAMDDYTALLSGSARYRDALGSGDDARRFADALARGGYATDPRYADKLAQVASRVDTLLARRG